MLKRACMMRVCSLSKRSPTCAYSSFSCATCVRSSLSAHEHAVCQSREAAPHRVPGKRDRALHLHLISREHPSLIRAAWLQDSSQNELAPTFSERYPTDGEQPGACTVAPIAEELRRQRTGRALGVQLLRSIAKLRLQAAQVGAQRGQLCARCAPARGLRREAPSI